ncbi:MAG: hypothetical protein Q8L29_00860 [archaeon]|nr:hypothetical protein [archaeon]
MNNMNNRGQIGDILYDNAIYLILVVIFTIGMFMFVWQQSNGAAIYEQYCVSEITRLINMAEAGDKINFDAQIATKIAKSNKVTDFNDIFRFNNGRSEVCVKLSLGRETCMKYYNNVAVMNDELKLGVPQNVLYFEIKERGVE